MAEHDALAAEIEASGLFDPFWYGEQYPDVGQSGLEPIDHYIRYGMMLRRDPGPGFDTRFYLDRYADVAAAGAQALIHYIRHGREEGRLCERPTRVEFALPQDDRPASAGMQADWAFRVATDAFARRGLQRLADVAIVASAADAEQWTRICAAAAQVGAAHDLFLLGSADLDFADVPPATASITLLGPAEAEGQAAELARFAGKGGLAGYDRALILYPASTGHWADLTGLAEAFRVDADWGCAAEAAPLRALPLEPASAQALRRAGLALPADAFAVPRGAALWIRPLLARIWRAAGDGPLSWDEAMDMLGAAAAAATMRVGGDPAPDPAPIADRPFRAVAFYLPQYHPIPENDLWWGKGFTEWRNVTRGRPLFDGHDQPRRPADLGYYDLRAVETQIAQAALAKQFGIHGFCYHYYWFEGRKLLNRPIEQMFASPDIDLPFCVCWANENWSRNWDGQHLNVLLEQQYSLDSNVALIRELIPMMKDRRWIRHDGKPVMLVYRISVIPNWLETARLWREECHRAGLGDIHLCAVRFDTERLEGQPGDHGLDAYILFPPHEVVARDARPDVQALDPAFAGALSSYDAVVDGDLARFTDGYDWPVHRGAMLAWDNMARRGANARIFHGATPYGFRRWMKGIAAQEAARDAAGDSLMFINAWNEWAEGTYLEPDESWGDAMLDSFRSAIAAVPGVAVQAQGSVDLRAIGNPIDRDGRMAPPPRLHAGRRTANPAWPTIMVCAHISGHQLFGGERSLMDVLAAFATMPVNIVLTLPSDNHGDYVDHLRDQCIALYAFAYPQWMDDRPPYAWLTLDFANIILRHGVDVVHANTIVLLEPLVAARMLGRTGVVHARELVTQDDVLCARIGRSAGEIVAAVLGRADWVIGNSAATCALYAQGGRALPVPNAVSVDDFDMPVRTGGPIRFGIVSSNIAAKGIADFAEVARLTAAQTDRARFVIIGPRTAQIDGWLAQVEAGERPANLEFAGYRDHPRDAMADIDVLLNLSIFGESFGRTVAEAMAARRPVIAWHWGALPELVDHGVTGWLLPYRDLPAVVARIVALCAAPQDMAPMGEAGRGKIAQHFSQGRLQGALRDAYARILPQEAGGRTGAAPMTVIVSAMDAPAATLRPCLDALSRHGGGQDVRIIVQTAQEETISGDGVTVSALPLADLIAQAGQDDIILLRPDALVRPRWLEGLRVAAAQNADAGMVMAADPRTDANDADALLRQQERADRAPAPVAAPSGACLCLRRAALDAADFAFPGRWDGQASQRLHRAIAQAGWRSISAPLAIVDIAGAGAAADGAGRLQDMLS